MADHSPTGRDDPDPMQALRGIAHLGDFAHRLMGNGDPGVRNKVDMMDSISLEDAFRGIIGSRSADIPEPLIDLRDTDAGLDAVIDTAGTPVRPGNLVTDTDDSRLAIHDPSTGWTATVDADEEIDDVLLASKDGDIVVVHTAFEGNDLPDDTDPVAEEEPDADLEPSPSQGVPTLNEFLNDNPWMRSRVEEIAGDGTLDMALNMWGHKPVDEVFENMGLMDVGGSLMDGDSEFADASDEPDERTVSSQWDAASDHDPFAAVDEDDTDPMQITDPEDVGDFEFENDLEDDDDE